MAISKKEVMPMCIDSIRKDRACARTVASLDHHVTSNIRWRGKDNLSLCRSFESKKKEPPIEKPPKARGRRAAAKSFLSVEWA